MPKFTCPHCQKDLSIAPGSVAVTITCPHCGEVVSQKEPLPLKPLWYHARDKKKQGPYSWQQLLTLAETGQISAEDMLLQEGARKWILAGTLRALFPKPKVPQPPAKIPLPSAFPERPSIWLIAGLAGVGISTFLGACLLVGFFFLGMGREPADANVVLPLREKNKEVEVSLDKVKQQPGDLPDAKATTAPRIEETKKSPEVKKSPSSEAWTEQFNQRFNQYRKKAGLAIVTFDPELSNGCLAHAKYLARNVDPKSVDEADLHAEERTKTDFTQEGVQAGKVSLVEFADPLTALERWMGHGLARVRLLDTEVQQVGLGFAPNAQGDWICVLDTERGRGDPVVIYPPPNQADVPLAFSGGLELPDPKSVGGFPVTVYFPPSKRVTKGHIELIDDQGKAMDSWVWTPEKPGPKGMQPNALGLIPRGLLRPNCTYQVKASAEVDARPWHLTWSFTTEDNSDSQGVRAKSALAKVNAYRLKAGLSPVSLDDRLSRGCLAHARYLMLNADHPAILGLKAHDEDLTLPGASEEGRLAGKASDIAIGDYGPLDGVDGWMATLYHRVPMLDPNLKTIGFGFARGRRLGWITVLNVVAGRERGFRSHAVYYPAPEQTDVPLHFPSGGEEPNPIPEDTDGRAGYPVTAFFPENESLDKSSARLTQGQGVEVPCWFSSPEKVANPKIDARFQGNTVCLIPKDPLEANTTYQVHLEGKKAGNAWSKDWKFTTGEAGLSNAEATRQVLERLNRFRSEGGLGNVSIDPELSRACQLHADYLTKNALVLLKKNMSVNDEDPLLPGFTAEGLRAARQTDVFTNAPVPVAQIDDLMATFSRRGLLLDPTLRRIGFGCSHDVGRGWRCVLNLNAGRGDARVVLYPAPEQRGVPSTGSDLFEQAASGSAGFPITITFPKQASPRNIQAVLADAGKTEWSLETKVHRNSIIVQPQKPLRSDETYSVAVSAVINGTEWRQTWQFTTRPPSP